MRIRRALLAGGGVALLIPSALVGASTVVPDLLGHSTGVKVVKSVSNVQVPGGVKSVINYTVQTKPTAVARAAGGAPPATGGVAAAAASNAKPAVACPAAGPGHEYMVVWAGKMNAGDLSGKDAVIFANGGNVNFEGIKEVLPQETIAGQDMIATVDVERGCSTYGNIVNVALIPGVDGVENEPHHMQYVWFPGQPVWAGGLFTSRLFTWDVSSLPAVKLISTQEPFATPGGSIWDAFDVLPDGTAYGTLMGGPLQVYGMTPGEVVHIGPKGEILGEFPATAAEGLPPSDANGLPTCPDLGSCANPHGIQARKDLGILVTSDYAEPARLVEDPSKPENWNVFRRTVRMWDISTPSKPHIVKVDVMPKGPRNESNPGHAENLGMMEVGKTWDYPLANGTIPKGFFSESMCGGAIFYTPDITNTASNPWHEVFDSAAAVFSPKAQSSFSGQVPNGGPNSQITEASGCDGGTWINVTNDNRFVLHGISGRYTNQDDFADSGTPKMLYAIDVQKLLAAGTGYNCNVNNIHAVMDPTMGGADCPTVAGVAPVNDTSTGGPHWGSFDNFTLQTVPGLNIHLPGGGTMPMSHAVSRLAFANYFVARTGVDGNHKLCMLNMDPKTGDLQYDNSFIDETLGTPCVNFNRRDWPGGGTKGYYKPHSMLFVENSPPNSGATFDSTGATTGYWGSEIHNGADTGGFPYSS
jgi:hypothetical protein